MKRWLMTVFMIAMLAVGNIAGMVSAEAEKETTHTITIKGEEFFVKEKMASYYVTEEIGLNIRELPDKDSELLGCLKYGKKVSVTGFVYKETETNGKKEEKKTGWVEIKITVNTEDGKKEKSAYIKNELSKEDPNIVAETEKAVKSDYYPETEKTVKSDYYPETESEKEYAQCPYCWDWYETGVSYRSHTTACSSNPANQQNYQCLYCGEWFSSLDALDSHVYGYCLDAHSGTCPYCGESFHYNGGAYDYHVATCPSNPAQSAYICPYCYMIMSYEEQYTHACG